MIDEDEVLIVTGAPRSGSAMMMRMLEMAGINVMTTNRVWMEHFDYLQRMHGGDVSWLTRARGKAVKIHAPLVYQVPNRRKCRWILMTRNPERQAFSLGNMFPGTEVERVDTLLDWILERKEPWAAVHYDDVISSGRAPMGVASLLDCHDKLPDMASIIIRDRPAMSGDLDEDCRRAALYEELRQGVKA